MDDLPNPGTIRTRAEFGAGLTALRQHAGLTVRELAKQIHRPAGTLGDYLSGRHVPSPAQQGLIVDVLAACGVHDEATVKGWMAALRRVRASADRRTTRSAPPYRGLEPFEPEDSALFFGRDEQTRTIVERVGRLRAAGGPSRGVLAVVGPSGSGKSSLLRAGVVAAVRAGALDSSERWSCSIVTPGDNAVGTVRAALDDAPGRPLLLVVDQFEELFTLTSEPEQRSSCLAALTDSGPDVVVALGMRADFYAEAAREPGLLDALQYAQVVVGPLTASRIREAVVGPATQLGIAVEDGLADLVLADLAPHDIPGVAQDVGSLPLLSHALLATWERSSGRRLTVGDYRATGGLDAAVQRTAEDVYLGLTPEQQDVAHQLFVRLVNVGDEVALTRRRISRTELGITGAGHPPASGDDRDDERVSALREVVDRFARRRLLTLSTDVVEISHEALLAAWPRLHSWLDTDRAGLLLHRRITTSANAWQATDRDPAALLAGSALASADDWAADEVNRRRLNALEQDFLRAGFARRNEQQRAERLRARRLRQLLTVVAVLALVAVGLAALARHAALNADHARRVATTARDEARSRQLAIQARELATSDPGLAQQLAVAGYQISHTVEARSELLDASARPIVTRVLGVDGPTPLAVSARGVVAVGHADDGSVHLLTTATNRTIPRAILPGEHRQLFALAFTPDGRILATGGQPRDVTLWDVQDPDRPRMLTHVATGFPDAVQSLTFSPDGRRLLAAGDGPRPLDEWDVSDPVHVVAMAAPGGLPRASTVQSVAYDRTGTSIAAVTLAGDVLCWRVSRPAAPVRAAIPASQKVRLDTVAFSPRTGQLVTGGNGGGLTVWDTRGPRLIPARVLLGTSDAEIDVVSFAADGRQLLSGSSDGSLRQWDPATWTPQATTPGPGPITGAAFLPGSATVLATSADGTLRRWPANSPQALVSSGAVFAAQFDATGGLLELAQNGVGGGVQLWDTRDPRALQPVGPLLTMTGGQSAIDGTGALSADAAVVAAGNSNGQVEVWDTRDPARPSPSALFRPSGARVESVALNADGSLLAVGGDDNAVSLWSLRDPSHPVRLGVVRAGNLILNIAFSPDGTLLAAGSADGTARLWDVTDPSRPRPDAVLRGFVGYVWGVAFAPDGRLLAATGADRTTRLWNVRDPRRPTRVGAPLRGPSDYAEVPSFDASGHLLAVPSNDRTVWVYDVTDPAHGTVLATLRAVQGSVFVATFGPHGRYLVAGGRDSDAPVWSVDPAADAALICAGAGDPITRSEWEQYVPGTPYQPPCR